MVAATLSPPDFFMARIYLRILASLFALAVLAGTVLGVYYVYKETYLPEKERTQEVRALLTTTAPKADPGKKQFDHAMELIRQGELEAARRLLTEITEVYQDSDRYQDSRRVLGEMNLDRLFSRIPMPGKLEYTAARGDSLQLIAQRFRTTLSYIKRVNNLLGHVVHPDDRLIVYPLDLSLQVDLGSKRLTVLKEGRYFKDYAIAGMHLPYPSLPEQTTVADKPAWIDNKKIQPTDERYPSSRKWLQTVSKPGRPGIVFCTPLPEAAAAPAAGPAPLSATPAGIYLSGPDIEELSTLIRVGAPVQFLKKPTPAARS
ncbi:MAG: LysM peptidoglycan-binding domain-containing protein [Verrucomicrobiota bacterium]